MKCPYCEQEMEPGYLQGTYLLWCEKPHLVSLNPANEREFNLFDRFSEMFKPGAVKGFLCRACNKAVLDIPERKE